MRYGRLLQLVSVLGLITVCSVELSYANGIWLNPDYENSLWNPAVILAVFCVTLVVEFLVIRRLLRSINTNTRTLFGWVFLVNLITNPAAQVGFLLIPDRPIFFSPSDAEIITLLCIELLVIEILVVLVEFVLLKPAFRSMYRRGSLNEPIAWKRTLKITILANFASFIVGLSGLLLWKIMCFFNAVI